jgi:hypothetical protein
MKRVTGDEYQQLEQYFVAAGKVAEEATCFKAKCGSIIVTKDGKTIGSGFNAPPAGDEEQRLCSAIMVINENPKYDKTCCVHAEWQAILNATKTHGTAIEGSTLYFMRVNKEGDFTDAGLPFCTVCSRLALESGVSYFALYNDNGADIYDTKEYNTVSYNDYVKR